MQAGSFKSKYAGFTIVELIIVVVVVGLLAAITVVSYSAVTRNARETAVKSDLNTATQGFELEQFKSFNRSGTPVNSQYVTVESDNAIVQFRYGSRGTFCFEGTSKNDPNVIFHTAGGESGATTSSGPCPEINFEITNRCLAGTVLTTVRYTNNTDGIVSMRVPAQGAGESDSIRGAINPGATYAQVHNRRTTSVPSGVFNFSISRADGSLLDNYYHFVPGQSC